VYVFHGAELSLKSAKRKLKRLRRKYNAYVKSLNGREGDAQLIEIPDDSEDSSPTSQARMSSAVDAQNENVAVGTSGATDPAKGLVSCLSDIYKDRCPGDANDDDDEESDDSFDSEEDDFSSDEDSDEDEDELTDDDDDDDDEDDDDGEEEAEAGEKPVPGQIEQNTNNQENDN
jgi:hypothetical protein